MLPKNIKISVYRMPVEKIFLAGDRMRVNRKHYKVEVARLPTETKAEEDALQQ